MKKTIITELGWYSPSSANWSYSIHLVIDKSGARLYRSTFGGEHGIIEKHKLEKLYAGKGSGVHYKWKDIKDLLDIKDYAGTNWPKHQS